MNYSLGDQVNLLILRQTDLGYVVKIDQRHEGLLFNNEIHQVLYKNQELKGFIKNIREDGKIDVTLRPQGYRYSIEDDCDRIIEKLKIKSILLLSDNSSPEEIKSQLGMSKKAFKKALGFLYKRKIIEIKKGQIELI